MKTILVIAGEENRLFIASLKSILHSLGVNAEIEAHKEDYKKSYDYIVLNSSFSVSNVNLVGGYCFINMDQILGNNINVNSNIITYGFGNKNTVTVSSVEREEEGMLYCLQRFINVRNNCIEPQEIPINIGVDSDEEIYACLVGVTMALMENMVQKDIKNSLNKKAIIKNI